MLEKQFKVERKPCSMLSLFQSIKKFRFLFHRLSNWFSVFDATLALSCEFHEPFLSVFLISWSEAALTFLRTSRFCTIHDRSSFSPPKLTPTERHILGWHHLIHLRSYVPRFIRLRSYWAFIFFLCVCVCRFILCVLVREGGLEIARNIVIHNAHSPVPVFYASIYFFIIII